MHFIFLFNMKKQSGYILMVSYSLTLLLSCSLALSLSLSLSCMCLPLACVTILTNILKESNLLKAPTFGNTTSVLAICMGKVSDKNIEALRQRLSSMLPWGLPGVIEFPAPITILFCQLTWLHLPIKGKEHQQISAAASPHTHTHTHTLKAKEYGAMFVESSAKAGYNVQASLSTDSNGASPLSLSLSLSHTHTHEHYWKSLRAWKDP